MSPSCHFKDHCHVFITFFVHKQFFLIRRKMNYERLEKLSVSFLGCGTLTPKTHSHFGHEASLEILNVLNQGGACSTFIRLLLVLHFIHKYPISINWASRFFYCNTNFYKCCNMTHLSLPLIKI